MKHFLLSIVIFFCIIGIVSCSDDGPNYTPENAPICPEDSIAYMDFFNALNLKYNTTSPNMFIFHVWKYVEFEYDETTRYRHIARITVFREKAAQYADSIPSSIGKLSHLRYLEIGNVKFNKNFTLPGEVFHCPLDTFIFGNWGDLEHVGIMGKLPSEIKMAKNTLKYLSIEGTALSELCEELADLTQLEKCILTYNRLSGRVPDYIGDMCGKVDLSYNHYTEFNWRQIIEGKNIPTLYWNYINNEIPPELKEFTFPQEIMWMFKSQNTPK